MLRERLRGSRVALIAAVGLALGAAGTAIGGQLITGKDVKNGSLKSKDVKQGTLKGGDVTDGSIGGADLSAGAKASVFSGPNWGIADRNVIGNGDSYLRAGPVVIGFEDVPAAEPPYGIGSLGLRTGSGEDKAAFGNQVDFLGDEFGIAQLGYWVYTTAENRAPAADNLPNIQFEIDANLTPPPSIDFTTATYVPENQLPGWNEIDAVADGEWFLTGEEGTATGCNQTTTCTWDELQEAVPEAEIFTVMFGKGRDHAFSGAVDGLQIDDTVYDFEPLGVRITAP